MASARTPISIASVPFGGVASGLVAIPSLTMGAMGLAASLLLYVVGLFAPVSNNP
jgi:hypothetical protein